MTGGTHKTTAPTLIAFAAGLSLWLATSFVTGKREPWDASLYWSGAYPLALLACALLGYWFPQRAWRWAIVLFEAQFVGLCIRNGELGSLWPLGMVMFAIIAVPGIFVASYASRLKIRRSPE